MDKSTSIPLASKQRRISSFVIDDMVTSFFFIAIIYDQLIELFSNVTVVNDDVLLAINLFMSEYMWLAVIIKIIYHTVFVWQNGMTLGKYIMKIKVVELESGQRPTFQKAFLRASLRVLSETLFYLGFVLAFFTPLRQTFHDKYTQCVVIDA